MPGIEHNRTTVHFYIAEYKLITFFLNKQLGCVPNDIFNVLSNICKLEITKES